VQHLGGGEEGVGGMPYTSCAPFPVDDW